MPPQEKPPLLVFDRIKGHAPGYRVATNLVNTPRRAALALGLPVDLGRVELVKLWKEKVKSLKPIPPVETSTGPVLQNRLTGDKVDATRFPAPTWHELDGGPYLGTACMVIMRDPEHAEWVNVGTYRVQVHGPNKLGLYISPGHHGRIICEKYWASGRNCPVAVTFGQEPATWIASAYAVPVLMSEYEWAGWARGAPVEVVKGPLTGLPIPATAEVAVEGEVPPLSEEAMTEGPFGEWPGYYAHGAAKEPVIRVTSVMYRDDPIIAGAPPLRPPHMTIGLPFGAAAIWEELEKMGIPDVRGVWTYSSSPSSGGGQLFIVISIKQRYAGHAMQAATVALGGRAGAYFGRFVVVVDEDIDPTDIHQVIWALSTRCDPSGTMEVVRSAWSTRLDPMIPPAKKAHGELTNSRAIIIACRPFHWISEFPPVNAISPALRRKVEEKWPHIFS